MLSSGSLAEAAMGMGDCYSHQPPPLPLPQQRGAAAAVFTAVQRNELENQALIYRYLTEIPPEQLRQLGFIYKHLEANPVPPELLLTVLGALIGALTPTSHVKDNLSMENPPREPTPLVVNTGPGLPQLTRPSFDLGSAPSSPPISHISFLPSLIPCSQWEKRECIGRGSAGLVYRGFNSEHGLYCAIKELTVIPDDARSMDLLKQMEQEIYHLEQYKHPNIVQYYRHNMTDTTLSIYMEYVSNGSIYKLLGNKGPFEESVIRSYTAQIVSGLVFLHGRKDIHRDIKGANILVGPNNEVKIADFGLVKHIQTLTAMHTSSRGTPSWMAPEVILSSFSGEGYNLSADIWSLGCTVIEMATAKPPLHRYLQQQAMCKIAFDKTYIPEIPDLLSDEGKDFVKLCLQRDRKARPSAAQLMDHPFIRNQGNGASISIHDNGQG